MMYETPNGSTRLPAPSVAARKVSRGAKGHFSGSLIVGDDEGRVMEVESHTELLVALVMLARHDVVALENQVPFRWIDPDGNERTHFFDFRVTFRDGGRIALIVKNRKKLKDAKALETASRIAGQVTSVFADRVCLVTDEDLDSVEVYNAELIYSVRDTDPEADAAVRRVVADTAGAVRVGDLVDATGLRGRGFRAVVRLIRSREMQLVRHERIDYDALLRRRAA